MKTKPLWPIDGQSIPCEPFQGQPLVETLLYFDGVLLSVSRLGDKQVLCCLSDIAEDRERWLQIEVSDEALASLKAGQLSLFDALSQGPLWVVDRDNAGQCVEAWLVSGLQKVPDDAKPEPGAMLYPARPAQ